MKQTGGTGATSSEWFGVRCLFRSPENKPWGPHDLTAGEYAYEERITLWLAPSASEAIELAEADAEQYASDIEAEYVGLAQSYRLPEEPGHGAEVFSLIRKSALAATGYIDAFFNTGSEYQDDVREG